VSAQGTPLNCFLSRADRGCQGGCLEQQKQITRETTLCGQTHSTTNSQISSDVSGKHTESSSKILSVPCVGTVPPDMLSKSSGTILTRRSKENISCILLEAGFSVRAEFWRLAFTLPTRDPRRYTLVSKYHYRYCDYKMDVLTGA